MDLRNEISCISQPVRPTIVTVKYAQNTKSYVRLNFWPAIVIARNS